MIEDKLLLLKFKFGSKDALARIYEKHKNYLLRLSTALLHDTNAAEDVVHDVFVSFAQSQDKIKLKGRLKSYLATCVVNRARNMSRAQKVRISVPLNDDCPDAADETKIGHWIICSEESRLISEALAQIPYEQREVVVLHLQGELKFREIAKFQAVSINTIQSRYRYGLDALRSILDKRVEK
jgi:RNA polymerase sigma-70 factor (ECF subfamily)